MRTDRRGGVDGGHKEQDGGSAEGKGVVEIVFRFAEKNATKGRGWVGRGRQEGEATPITANAHLRTPSVRPRLIYTPTPLRGLLAYACH